MSDVFPKPRKNGLTHPHSPAQVAGWVALGASALEFALCVAPILAPCAIAPVALVFALAVTLVAHAGAQTVLIDPVDVHLCRHWRDHDDNNNNNHNSSDPQPPPRSNALHNPLHRPPSTARMSWKDATYWHVNGLRQDLPVPQDETMKQCWICDTQVADHSMHCKFCNKCVYHFDHHCMCECLFDLDLVAIALRVCCAYQIYMTDSTSSHVFGITVAFFFFGLFPLYSMLNATMFGSVALFNTRMHRAQHVHWTGQLRILLPHAAGTVRIGSAAPDGPALPGHGHFFGRTVRAPGAVLDFW
jgi:hypothetical protein